MTKNTIIFLIGYLMLSNTAFAEDFFGFGEFVADNNQYISGETIYFEPVNAPCNSVEIYAEADVLLEGSFTFSEEWQDYTKFDETSTVQISMPQECSSIELFID